MEKNLGIVALVIGFLVFAAQAQAHVVVKPSEAGLASYQTFSMGVPVEKDIPTTSVRLLIPDGVVSVMPNVKPGWNIETKKVGQGEGAKVTEIVWSGGTIPAGQRDEFVFSAKMPDSETTVEWKAYQTYQDGTVVSWDQEGHDMEEGGNTGPASKTTIIDDLATAGENEMSSKPNANLEYSAIGLSILAIAMAGYSLSKKR